MTHWLGFMLVVVILAPFVFAFYYAIGVLLDPASEAERRRRRKWMQGTGDVPNEIMIAMCSNCSSALGDFDGALPEIRWTRIGSEYPEWWVFACPHVKVKK